MAKRMNKRVSKRWLIGRALLHVFFPRRFFKGLKCSYHARARFEERYGVPLSNYDYEVLNLRLLLGNMELLAISPDKTLLHSCWIKKQKIYTISFSGEGRIRTFYTKAMMKKFFNAHGTVVHEFDMDSMRETAVHENLNVNFKKYIDRYKLVYFDKHLNQSIYKINDREMALYAHDTKNVVNIIRADNLDIFEITQGIEIRDILDHEFNPRKHALIDKCMNQ